jgi:hypothetical protein
LNEGIAINSLWKSLFTEIGYTSQKSYFCRELDKQRFGFTWGHQFERLILEREASPEQIRGSRFSRIS